MASARPSRTCALTLATVAWALAVAPTRTTAQLISPGRLSQAHSELEGIRSCTRCHELRQRGIAAGRCLDCHTPLARRLEAALGYHATVADDDCATCHKEHLGEDFQLVRLDETAFDHAQVAYELEGGHADVDCRACHTPSLITDPDVRAFKARHAALDRTFLGLPTECAACHEPDAPHESQFQDRPCSECHDTRRWDDAPGFDHGQSSYPLTGAHRTAPCAACHRTTPGASGGPGVVRYLGIASGRCNDCHEDQHAGRMPGACSTCHETAGWRRVGRELVETRFDHDVTGFLLEGRHATAPCSSCHDASAAAALPGVRIALRPGSTGQAFPRPEAGACRTCHVDVHEGRFDQAADPRSTAAQDCTGCHDQSRWAPAAYDVARHNREAGFTLEGAHLTVACDACHTLGTGTPGFGVDDPTCQGCHQDTDPHAGQFQGRTCESCHSVATFGIADFDHERTRFRLEGAHVAVSCGACHVIETPPGGPAFVRYRPLGTECRNCHEAAS